MVCLKHCVHAASSVCTFIDKIPSAGTGKIGDQKRECYRALSSLEAGMGHFAEVIRLLSTVISGDHNWGPPNFWDLYNIADIYNQLGNYKVAKQMLARALVFVGDQAELQARLFNLPTSIGWVADLEASGKILAHQHQVLAKYFWEGNKVIANFHYALGALTFALIDGDVKASRMALTDVIKSRFPGETNPPTNTPIFHGLAILSFLEGNTDEAKRLLLLGTKSKEVDSYMAIDCAIVLLREGSLDTARKILRDFQVLVKSLFHVIPVKVQGQLLYVYGMLELASRDFAQAYRIFEVTKNHCESINEYHIRALSTRAMGELAHLQPDLISTDAKADMHFEETVSICVEAGIVPTLLYRQFHLVFVGSAPPATYEKWPRFLEQVATP
jgi:tetratricopeptide (TPR) repeat protein